MDLNNIRDNMLDVWDFFFPPIISAGTYAILLSISLESMDFAYDFMEYFRESFIKTAEIFKLYQLSAILPIICIVFFAFLLNTLYYIFLVIGYSFPIKLRFSWHYLYSNILQTIPMPKEYTIYRDNDDFVYLIRKKICTEFNSDSDFGKYIFRRRRYVSRLYHVILLLNSVAINFSVLLIISVFYPPIIRSTNVIFIICFTFAALFYANYNFLNRMYKIGYFQVSTALLLLYKSDCNKFKINKNNLVDKKKWWYFQIGNNSIYPHYILWVGYDNEQTIKGSFLLRQIIRIKKK